MKRFFFIFFIFTLEAIAPSNFFLQFPNLYFVESGSFYGAGIQQALDSHFPIIHSIEIQRDLYKRCKKKFIHQPNVHLWIGDSSKILSKIINNIHAPITFWLDGHYSGEGTGKGQQNSPILAELDQIMHHPIKTHTIIIDDVRQFGTADFDFITKEQIIEKLLSINPHYQISFHNGYVEDDVLVAKP